MQNLLDFNLPQLTDWLASQGEKPFRARQVFHWIHQRGEADFAQMTDLAKSLREKLIRNAEVRAPAVKADKDIVDIAERIRLVSDDVLVVGESSLYPALQRLLVNGWVTAEWGASDNNRRARYYTLTASGRKRLTSERKEFQRLIGAIQQVLDSA